MEDTTSEGLRLRDDDIEDTVIRRPRGAGGGDRFDDVLGDTVIRPRTEPSEPVGDRADDGADDPADDGADDPADDGADPEDTVVRARVRTVAGPSVPAGAATGLPSVPAAPAARVPSIRIGDRTFRLDHPVVIGRRPSLPRITSGPEPELVTVRSANGQVSSSHVRIHAEGEAVVVQDLRSTNGTVVRPAGAPVYRMASGASIVALTGTVVEVGDGNAIEVLSPYLRVAPTADGFPPVPPWPTDQTAHGTPRTPRERS
ncbi:FHA domain-containing protein [Curtobacterium sp. PhB42]|uniref:FHA domain-containing protein n=1 Tax=unclassified Curtobacterium TaxID=257496 RepID=UPI0010F05F69|nr:MULTISPECIES: FHA domain-containing protein [unclassified Curtobacterium]TCU84755.1 FHA domain-containing protein [Curtobacterium sp. PhB191]TDW50547.1 FHA domain-containing protein [Curtobacterium sp. PhB42]TDW55150.1 FHA domain-containing protein [Curtobacterium sp. PhB190]